MHLRDRLGMDELPGMAAADVLSFEIDQTILTVRVAQEA
jgi:hypothetical protein